MIRPRAPLALTSDQKRAWLRLIRSENVGPTTFRTLLNHFGGAAAALAALPDLARRGGGRTVTIASEAEIDRELAAADAAGARFVALGEADYPPDLARIEAPPPLIAVTGSSETLRRPAVALVGARTASLGGRKIAGMLAQDLGAADLVVVSGLARGIDAAAHEASLATGTIAVMAGGLDRIYPPEHVDLFRRIVAEGGAVVSEMPFGWTARAKDFPRRNRLISGISLAVVVVEAALKSGSLHTARFAGEQGREVMAVPGSPLDPRAEGCNALIRDGATLVRSAADILADIAPLLDRPPMADHPFAEPDTAPDNHLGPDNDARAALHSALGLVPVSVDELARDLGLPLPQLQLLLVELELAGRLERLPGGRVARIA